MTEHDDDQLKAKVETPSYVSMFAGQWVLDAIPEIREFSKRASIILEPFFV